MDYPIENPDCRWWKDAFLGTRKTRRMKRCLRALSGLIHCMSNLTTFSFEIRHDASGGTTNLQFPRDTLTKMLLALPQTCINLEITICGPEEQNNRRPDNFCQTLGQILPRLRHLRLQVGRLCPEFLGRGVVKKDDADGSICIEEFKPFYTPNLKSMVIDCHCSLNSYYIDIPSDQTELCESYCAKGSREGKSDAKFEAGPLLRSLLHDLVQRSNRPVINRLLVHSWQPGNGTVKMWDVIGSRTWAVPARYLGAKVYLTRTPEGVYAVCDHQAIIVIALKTGFEEH